MSHNQYSRKSDTNNNVLNSIINSTYQANQNRLVSNAPKSYTIFEIVKFLVELTVVLIAFGMFCFMLAMSPAIDAQILQWQGR